MRTSRLFAVALTAFALPAAVVPAVAGAAASAGPKYGYYYDVVGTTGVSFRVDRGLSTVSQVNATCTTATGMTGSIALKPKLSISHGRFGYDGRVTLFLPTGRRVVRVAFKGHFARGKAVGTVRWANTGDVTCAPGDFTAKWLGVKLQG